MDNKEILVYQKVDSWFHEYSFLFNLKEVHGFHVISELYHLVKMCEEIRNEE